MPAVGSEHRVEGSSTVRVLAEGFAWGVLCAISTAVAGLLGHLIGSRLYPQQYEQIPSDLFFVPLGLLVGFVAAGVARVASREWGFTGMFAFLVLVASVYGGLMFHYSQAHALPAKIIMSTEPGEPTPVGCTPGACTRTDPASNWLVAAQLRIEETSGLGVTIDSIEITSNVDSTGREPRRRYTKEDAQEAQRWIGPLVTLVGRDIPGPRRIRANQVGTYAIRYNYHTQDGVSRRRIELFVRMTDGAGRPTFGVLNWRVN